jgi:two-component system, OmpR family, alkaline phosphatase synthesis response regulator PhoP
MDDGVLQLMVREMARRVLIIDDEDDIREVAQASMEFGGDWIVDTAKSGLEGIELAAREAPDVILLDVMMPDTDGPATLQLLRADPRTRGIPVVLLTAKVQRRDRFRLIELGAAGIIAKPFDPCTLADEVSSLIAAPRLSQP